jgi:hypothetical protein
MKQPRPSLMRAPLLFIVACAVHDCRLKVEQVEKVERADRPAAAPEPVRCDDGEAPPELWDGTGRSEAVRGA